MYGMRLPPLPEPTHTEEVIRLRLEHYQDLISSGRFNSKLEKAELLIKIQEIKEELEYTTVTYPKYLENCSARKLKEDKKNFILKFLGL